MPARQPVTGERWKRKARHARNETTMVMARYSFRLLVASSSFSRKRHLQPHAIADRLDDRILHRRWQEHRVAATEGYWFFDSIDANMRFAFQHDPDDRLIVRDGLFDPF